MLHNAILALGLCYADEPHLREVPFRALFAKEAKKYLDSEGEDPTIATVQALSVLSSYHSLAAEHNLGWLYIGLASRVGQARKLQRPSVFRGCTLTNLTPLPVGINIDSSPLVKTGRLSPVEAHQRDVAFWSCFVQEELWGIYIGRAANVQPYTCVPLSPCPMPVPSFIFRLFRFSQDMPSAD
jgi:hypothetical protein